eukprot:164242_1
MAQTFEPGVTDEAKNDEKQSNFSTLHYYQCVFRKIDNNLYISLTNTKTNLSFTNTFSKSHLQQMNISQPIDMVIAQMETALSGTTTDFKMQIAFGDAEQTKNVSGINQLSKQHKQGYALHVFMSVSAKFCQFKYNLILLESTAKKDIETYILHELILKMQQEIVALKQKVNGMVDSTQVGIVEYKSSKNVYGPYSNAHCIFIPFDIEIVHRKTMQRMTSTSDDNQYILMECTGTYKVTLKFGCCVQNLSGGSSQAASISYNIRLYLNNQEIGNAHNLQGVIVQIISVKKGDKINVKMDGWCCSNNHWNKNTNSLVMERIK